MLAFNIISFLTLVVHPILNYITKNNDYNNINIFNKKYLPYINRVLILFMFWQYFVNIIYNYFSIYRPWIPVNKNININILLMFTTYWMFI